jgi:hypothetical protein
VRKEERDAASATLHEVVARVGHQLDRQLVRPMKRRFDYAALADTTVHAPARRSSSAAAVAA